MLSTVQRRVVQTSSKSYIKCFSSSSIASGKKIEIFFFNMYYSVLNIIFLFIIEKYDVAIVGGGPGGYVAAIKAGQLGLKVKTVPQPKLI